MNRRIAILLGLLFFSCSCATRPASSIQATVAPHRDYTLNVKGGVIHLTIQYDQSPISDEAIIKWVNRSAEIVSRYFSRFPVREVAIVISTEGQGRLENGHTSEDGIQVKLRTNTRQTDLDDDWVMVHEMFHLSFPSLDDKFTWLQEGLATYLEPLARARAGAIPAARYWHELAQGLPQGQPKPGDAGLNGTTDWGRQYWGGCAFCLRADIMIRQSTANAKSLDDALKAILNAGGDHLQEWSIDRVLDVGDKATGTHVLRDLYAEMALKAHTVDLPKLWTSLGVIDSPDSASFDDSAPLSQIRREMLKQK